MFCCGLTFSAKFVVNVRGYTEEEDDMVCLDLIVDFVSTTAHCEADNTQMHPN